MHASAPEALWGNEEIKTKYLGVPGRSAYKESRNQETGIRNQGWSRNQEPVAESSGAESSELAQP